MGRKLGRPKAGQETLSRERILNIALQLIDREGVEAFSMRRLASELGVDPMAIYYHLPNKRAVLTSVIERVFNELQLPQIPDTTWQNQVRTFAKSYCKLTQTHPNLVLYLVSDAESAGIAALAANEALYTALISAGLSPRMVVRAADLVVDYLNGFALGERSGRLGQPGERQELLTQLQQHPPEQFPSMHHIFSSLTENEMFANFEAGIDIILAGIEASTHNTVFYAKSADG
ncbi:TetR/AcrR family transcriptional regulator C-terminal domain-containing protein [Scytonema sp. NUACC21]